MTRSATSPSSPNLRVTTDFLHQGTNEWYLSTAETTEKICGAEKPRRRRSP